jgi:putative DNA methylase
MKKRLIEYDLPLADISEESAREKNMWQEYPSTRHIWRMDRAFLVWAASGIADRPGGGRCYLSQ